MPAKKSIKKVVKKKQVKKSIRNKIKKQHEEQNNNEMSLMNPSSTNPSSISQLHGQNSLRAQLLARAAFAPTLGFTPQQYGNFTNEKRIEQLRNDNNTMNSQITNDKALIASIEKQNEDLKKEVAELKKKKKESKSKLDKARHESEMVEDELQESKRIDMETMRQQQRKQNAQLQLSEYNRQNEIIKNKTEADTLEAQTHTAKMMNQQLLKKYEENKAYQRLTQLRNEYENIVNENQSLQTVMADPSFANPNEELKKVQLDIMKEQYKKELNEKKIQKQMELNDIKNKSQTIPATELEAYTTQHIEDIKKLETDILAEKEKMRPNQQKINEYQYMLDKEDELEVS